MLITRIFCSTSTVYGTLPPGANRGSGSGAEPGIVHNLCYYFGGCGKQKKLQCRHDNFSLCRCYFRSKLARTHGEGGATRQAPNSNTRNGKFVQETFTKPLHLLTFFPNQNGCDFFDRLKCKCSIIHGSRSGYFRDQRGHRNRLVIIKMT